MRVACLVLMALVAGCAGQVKEPNYYLMRSNHDLESRELKPSRDFSMGNVVIAAYIDQPGLILETNDGEIRAAHYNLWAEPVYEGVRNQLTVEIARVKGEDVLPAKMVKTPIVLDIRIDQLHGTNTGTAKLVAYWWLHRDKEVLAAYKFAEEQALETDGYGALVTAEQVLLSQLAREIAATLVVTDR